jgi:hypothetical protein
LVFRNKICDESNHKVVDPPTFFEYGLRRPYRDSETTGIGMRNAPIFGRRWPFSRIRP